MLGVNNGGCCEELGAVKKTTRDNLQDERKDYTKVRMRMRKKMLLSN